MNVKRWPESVLLLIGLALLLLYAGAKVDSEMQYRARIHAFQSRPAHPTSIRDLPIWRRQLRSEIKFDLWSPARVKGYEASLNVKNLPELAILRIPRITLEVPVLDSTDEIALNRGVGWIEGTARPGEVGNIGIAGHRDGFFRGLKDVHTGDAVELELSDVTETYIVTSIDIVSPSDLRPLAVSDQTSLTLVTCYPFYYVGSAPLRYVVHARLQIPGSSAIDISNSRKETRNQENGK